jgi:hypothetical protein
MSRHTPSNSSMLSHSVTPIAYRSDKTLAHVILPWQQKTRTQSTKAPLRNENESAIIGRVNASIPFYLDIGVFDERVEAEREAQGKTE